MANTKPNEINLKVADTKLDDGKIQLKVTIPAATTADICKGAAFVLAMQNKLDVQNIKIEDLEAEVLELVGEAQLKAFTNHYAMSAMAPFAIVKKNIEPIMEPELNSGMEIAPGKEFTFTAVVTPKPHYELSSYDPVTVKVPKVTITEEELDAQLFSMAERAAQSAEDKGAAVAENSEIVIGIASTFKDTGEAIEHLTAERRVYVLGSGFLPEDFDSQLIGMKAEESKTFDFDIPGIPGADGELSEARTANTTVNIIQVNHRVVPAITDAWVEVNVPEAKNVEGLRELLRAQGMEYKAQEQSNMTLEQYLQNMGMEQQQFNMTFMMQVRETLRQSFALDALARHLKLTVSEEDIADTLSRMAPGNEERARQELVGSGRTYLLTEAALRTKANKWLAETATFIEEE